jgi:hypothetical protein
MSNQQDKKSEPERGTITIVHHFEDGRIEVEKVRSVIRRGGKARVVTPEMRKAVEDRREAYLAELRARIGPRKSGKAKPAPRKRAA